MFRLEARGADTAFVLDGRDIALAHGAKGCEDIFEELSSGVYHWVRRAAAPTDHMEMALTDGFSAAFTMIPAVSYNGNGWGGAREYVGFERDGEPYVFAGHRMAIPCATFSGAPGASCALFARAEDAGSCAFVHGSNGHMTHVVLFPERESPVSYFRNAQDAWIGGYARVMPPRDRFEAFIVLSSDQSYRRLLDAAWRIGYESTAALHSDENCWQLGIAYAKALYTREGSIRAFAMGYKKENGRWIKHSGKRRYEIGWCGQNASLANSLIHHHMRYGDLEALEMGESVLDYYVNNCRLPGGLMRALLEPPCADDLEDACNLGTAAMQLFEAHAVLKKAEYLDAALSLCRFAACAQSRSGLIGKAWNAQGECIMREGTIGAFFIPPLLTAHDVTGESVFLRSAERAYWFYIQELRGNGFTTAGALDTYCIDKESAIPLLKSALAFFARTENARYLADAVRAAEYLSTWQWHAGAEYPEDSGLRAMHYNPFGGTAVSTAHHHIDHYALAYVHELRALSRFTGDDIWRERADAIWNHSTQGITTSTGDRPIGAQDEGYYHTRWLRPYEPSGWLVAWPTALRLEVLRRANNP